MAELLLELLSEEIPARMQERAAEDLKRLVCEGLDEKRLGKYFSEARSFVTPRRLALVIDNLPERQMVGVEVRKGPRSDAPEQAIKGFKGNLPKGAKVKVRETTKGTFLFASIPKSAQPAPEVLPEIVEAALAKVPWLKSMRWGGNRVRWVRPVHGILCLFGGKVVPVEFGPVKASNTTAGHRFLAPELFAVEGFADYKKKLRHHKVILDPAARREVIWKEAQKLAKAEGLTVEEDDALLAEVAGMVEWPRVFMGRVDEAFMDLPPEVLTTVMRQNQKYFALLKKDGALAPRFIVVADTAPDDGGKAIVAGNERVLRARLADARFFWDKDRMRTLESRLPALEEIIFHEKLGTMSGKIERMQVLAAEIGARIPDCEPERARRAALLCKADLPTQMVGEFPELQGVMGRYYALHDGERPEAADAIAEHYSPLGPNDECPTAPVSVAVALADKIDTLVGFWAIDEKPTGSKDPYALRRAALGVVRLIVENELRVPLRSLIATTYITYIKNCNVQRLDAAQYEYDMLGAIGETLANDKDVLMSSFYSGYLNQYGKIDEIYKILDHYGPNRIHQKINKDDWTDFVSRLEDVLTIAMPIVIENEEQEDKIQFENLTHESINRLIKYAEHIANELLHFFAERLKVHLKEQGVAHDLISAVFAVEKPEGGGEDDLVRLLARVDALKAFLENDDGEHLLTAYKRASNIVRIEEKRDGKRYNDAPVVDYFEQDEEKALHASLTATAQTSSVMLENEDFSGAMAAFARLRGPVDRFFDEVTVNCDDAKLRENRLRLLSQIRSALDSVADFSRIEGESRR